MRRLKSRAIQLRFICMFGCAMGLDGCVRYIDGVHRTTNLHTLVTELVESGAGDEVIMRIAGHVSRAMLSRYSQCADGCDRRPRRDRWAAEGGRREAQGGRRTAAEGCDGDRKSTRLNSNHRC